MHNTDFHHKVEILFDNIIKTIEKFDEDVSIEIDMRDGILTLITDDGTFVINKQSAVSEIWLSSPISGPYHFVEQNDQWLSRNGDKLLDILTKDLKMQF